MTRMSHRSDSCSPSRSRAGRKALAAVLLAGSLCLGGAGCAQLCSMGGSSAGSNSGAGSDHVAFAGPKQQKGKAKAAPVVFNDDSFYAPPQNVNIFGEVNGARTRGATPVTEVGFQQHTFTDEGYDSDVSVDPTGKWLVFASTRNSEHPSIYMQRVDGTAVTQLTSDADDDYPAFSPDGKQIAFSSTRPGTWQIFVMDADGRNVTQVTSGTSQAIHPSFSPDGSRIVYSNLSNRSGQWELWVVNLKTSERRMIGYGLFPTWSPDRTADRIAFQRARQRGSRWFSLWTLDLINGEARRVTEFAVSANAAIIAPSWSPDGRRLAFTTVLQPATASGSRPRGQTDVWTVDATGTNRQRLTDGRATNLTPFWSSDNRIYFISDRGGAECIWSVRADSAPSEQPTVAKDTGKKEASPAPVKEAPAVGATDPHEVEQ